MRERRSPMTQIKSPIWINLEKKGRLTVAPNDYIASGGEGSVYRVSDTVIKLYDDHRKLAAMKEKIALLARIRHPYIVAPQGIVENRIGETIGIWMPYATGEPLPRLFTNDFRMRENFTDKDAARFSHKMQETVRAAHAHGALLIDPNELNWLAALGGANGPEPRIIDVDSWAIGKWPAVAVMQTIRDWHAKEFTQLSDWFAWGIVTFQIFTGIHPYKGTIDGFKPSDIEGRMRANASVFSKKAKLSRAVRDFSRIPAPLLDWYMAVFQNGERSIPPSPLAAGLAVPRAAAVQHITAASAGTLIFDKLYGDAGDPAVRVWPCGIIMLRSGNLFDVASKRVIGAIASPNGEVIATHGGWLVADWDDGEIVFSHIAQKGGKTEKLRFPLNAQRLLRHDDRMFVTTKNGITEVIVRDLGRPVISAGNTWGVMLNAARWFDGAGIQDAMGAMFLIMPTGKTALLTLRIRELDGMKPLAAKAENGFAVIIAADKRGAYRKFEILVQDDAASYQIWEDAADNPEIVMTMLPKGAGATITDDGELTVFVPATRLVTKVRDPRIAADMMLARIGNKAAYLYRGEAWSITMRRKS